MMPADGIETLRSFDAILLGAVGWPAEGAGFRLAARPSAADPQGLRAICQYPPAPAAAGRRKAR